MPCVRQYWLWPASIASIAARVMKSGPLKSGKPLPEVDRAVAHGEPGHLCENGGPEAL